jgi:hypothetical protein
MLYYSFPERKRSMPPSLLPRRRAAVLVLFLWGAAGLVAAYKARPYSARTPDAYPARLTSEGVTIGVEPLFSDTLAAQAFDKNDVVTRGIIPLAVAIFNDNGFPIAVDGMTAELIRGEDRVRTRYPGEVVKEIFKKSGKSTWIPNPLPRLPSSETGNVAAMDDFDQKFLSRKVVSPHDKGIGFLYLHIPESKDVRGYLAKARLYIPEVQRYDTGASMIYFEIELEPALRSAP